ncbi:monothiol glutaredoxin, Grx4 family protein [Nitzschia inconspicua]|uniref:Monothiol glutaredoxin, Grx4 family protein n=1 Tax=Nitzschia inconspicua TaxID=303405 RepID=A0A9K3KIZ3_9STRA|nr:monothiol glutaredoxin, Grx4 family protein [Nitzschia inconspicua]
MSNGLTEIKSTAEFVQHYAKKAVILFCAEWHEATPTLKMILQTLAKQEQSLLFATVDAEAVSDLADKFDVTMVPTLVLLNGGTGKDPLVLEKLEGVVEPSKVTVAVQRLIQAPEGESTSGGSAVTTPTSASNAVQDAEQALNERLKRLIHGDTVMLFMKGTPSAPRCGFSRQAVELLNEHQVPFGSFDILSDEDVRQGLKKYSDWPTYPQIYVKGELMGGLDILKETAEEGSLKEQWELDDGEGAAPIEMLQSRLEKLVNRHKVMLFLKGLPSAPQCGFSRQIVEILDESDVAYDAFNILEDEEIRQGLKEFSDWPTYPQLYVNGDLVGGLDIVKELKDSNELDDLLKG